MCLSTNSSPDQERSMFNLSSRAKIERWRICDEESRNRSLRAAQREGTNRSCTVRRNASRYFASPGVEWRGEGGGGGIPAREDRRKRRGGGGREQKGTKRALTGYTNCQRDGIASSPRVSSPRGTVKKIRPRSARQYSNSNLISWFSRVQTRH